MCVTGGGGGGEARERAKQFSLFYSEKGRKAASNYFGLDMKVKRWWLKDDST